MLPCATAASVPVNVSLMPSGVKMFALYSFSQSVPATCAAMKPAAAYVSFWYWKCERNPYVGFTNRSFLAIVGKSYAVRYQRKSASGIPVRCVRRSRTVMSDVGYDCCSCRMG